MRDYRLVHEVKVRLKHSAVSGAGGDLAVRMAIT